MNYGIGQFIIEGDANRTTPRTLITNSNLRKVSIYALPGCTFQFNNSENTITINHTGLFNFSLPNDSSIPGIGSITVTRDTFRLLAETGAVAVVDYVFAV